MAKESLSLRKNEWLGIAVGVSDDVAFTLASKRLGVDVKQLEMRVSGGAKLFRIMEDDMAVEIKQDTGAMAALDAQRVTRLTKRKLAQAEAAIVDLVILAKGCPDHPQYRAGRKSKVECETCENLYRLAQLHLKGK